ncbi:MAG: permease, partial [Candidatus Omnitrophica bacterium]|nr:permease [Candidatus Omnitrophota bacterium]
MVDPVCGMAVGGKTPFNIKQGGNNYYFCSRACLDRFRQSKQQDLNLSSCCLNRKRAPFYRNKVLLVSFIVAGVIAISYFIPVFSPLRHALIGYFKKLWLAMLLGLFLGGIIDNFIPREYICYLLASPKKKTIIYAVFMGFLMSACSHGILALAIQLHKKGASTSGVLAFLLASPWANIVLTVMLLSFFGFKAFYIIISAIVIAFVSGMIFQLLENKGLIEKNMSTVDLPHDFSMIQDIKSRIANYSFSINRAKKDLRGIFSGILSLADMVLWWVFIGMILASVASAYVPSDLLQGYLGPTIGGIFLTLLIAAVIEVCSEGSAPMAFELFRQTGAFGN